MGEKEKTRTLKVRVGALGNYLEEIRLSSQGDLRDPPCHHLTT